MKNTFNKYSTDSKLCVEILNSFFMELKLEKYLVYNYSFFFLLFFSCASLGKKKKEAESNPISPANNFALCDISITAQMVCPSFVKIIGINFQETLNDTKYTLNQIKVCTFFQLLFMHDANNRIKKKKIKHFLRKNTVTR